MSAWQAAAACECASTRAQMWAACTRKRDAKKDWERGQMERKSKAKKTNSNCETQLNCVQHICLLQNATNKQYSTYTHCLPLLFSHSPPFLSPSLSHSLYSYCPQLIAEAFKALFKRLQTPPATFNTPCALLSPSRHYRPLSDQLSLSVLHKDN